MLRTSSAENQLVERGTTIRQALLRPYDRRVSRGEGNPLPGFQRCVYASTELAVAVAVSVGRLLGRAAATHGAADRTRVTRRSPAPDASGGLLRDALGPVSIHPDLRRQNTAVPGTVEQGKTSYLVATIHEDLRARALRGDRL